MFNKQKAIIIAQEDRAKKLDGLLESDIPSFETDLRRRYVGPELDAKLVALEGTKTNIREQLENIDNYQGPTEVD